MKAMRNSVAVAVVTAIILAVFGIAAGSAASAKTIGTDVKGDIKYETVATGTYNFDAAHTVIGFGVRHLGIAVVAGRFKDIKGTVEYNADDVTKSSVEFTAKIESIDTGVAQRDGHLKSADFFDAAKYPEMTFKSTKVEKKNGKHILTGDLTIKGVTKQVSFPFTMTGGVKDPWGGTRFGIAAGTNINRRDFGITWGNLLPSGALDVANEVAVELHVEAVKAQPKAGN